MFRPWEVVLEEREREGVQVKERNNTTEREREMLDEEKRGDGRLGEGRQARQRVSDKNGIVPRDLRGE